jgi:hypothetical protein
MFEVETSAGAFSGLSATVRFLSSGNKTLNMRVINTVSRVVCKPDSGMEPRRALEYVLARGRGSRLLCSPRPGLSIILVELGPVVEEEAVEAFAEMTCIFVLDPVLTVLLDPNMQFKTVLVASLKSSSRPSSPPALPKMVDERPRE